MTILVGLLCKDAVVIGADTSATFGPLPHVPTMEQPTRKISIISDRIIVAGTGAIGLNQRFCEVVQKSSDNRLFSNKNTPIEIAKELSRQAQQDFSHTFTKQGTYGALVAFPCGSEFNLVELAVADFQPELKDKNIWYVAMGSGQNICDPFLGLMRKVFWSQDRPDKSSGTFAVAWSLQHAVDVNPGGIKDPIDIAILEDSKQGPRARLLTESELSEHRDSVTAAENHLADYKKILAGSTPLDDPVPEVKHPNVDAKPAPRGA